MTRKPFNCHSAVIRAFPQLPGAGKSEHGRRIYAHLPALPLNCHLCCSAAESALDRFRKLLIFIKFVFCHLSRQNAGSHAGRGLGASLPRSSTKLSTGAVGEARPCGKPADTRPASHPLPQASKGAGWRGACARGRVLAGLPPGWINAQPCQAKNCRQRLLPHDLSPFLC